MKEDTTLLLLQIDNSGMAFVCVRGVFLCEMEEAAGASEKVSFQQKPLSPVKAI